VKGRGEKRPSNMPSFKKGGVFFRSWGEWGGKKKGRGQLISHRFSYEARRKKGGRRRAKVLGNKGRKESLFVLAQINLLEEGKEVVLRTRRKKRRGRKKGVGEASLFFAHKKGRNRQRR